MVALWQFVKIKRKITKQGLATHQTKTTRFLCEVELSLSVTLASKAGANIAMMSPHIECALLFMVTQT